MTKKIENPMGYLHTSDAAPLLFAGGFISVILTVIILFFYSYAPILNTGYNLDCRRNNGIPLKDASGYDLCISKSIVLEQVWVRK